MSACRLREITEVGKPSLKSGRHFRGYSRIGLRGVLLLDCRLSDLRYREVVNVSTCCRLCYVSDVVFSLPEGKICALIVPGPSKLFGLLGREEDYILPWKSIVRVGSDIILVEIKGDFVRRKRQNHWFEGWQKRGNTI